ncbi:MAG: TerB family tellurite resistance protein [Pseudomonadota bacterium]
MSESNSVILLRSSLKRLGTADLNSTLEHYVSAAVMVHAVPIDGVVRDEELEAIHRILCEDFELPDDKVSYLISMMLDEDRREGFFAEVIDLAKAELSDFEKRNLISQMWEVCFSDGHLHEAEGNLVLQAGVDMGLDAEEAISLMTSNSTHPCDH